MNAMRNLKVLYAVFGVLVVAVIIGTIAVAKPAAEQLKAAKSVEQTTLLPAKSVPDSTKLPAKSGSTEVGSDNSTNNASAPAVNTPINAAAPGSSTEKPNNSSPAPAKQEAGGHVPFTNLPVTPGDPASYVDTVGQCPFYEMAGAKGCVPPPDIECNADWSVCTYKGGN